jgi:hypothetical protein
MINDSNVHTSEDAADDRKYAEFCYGCMVYDPEVVLAYD